MTPYQELFIPIFFLGCFTAGTVSFIAGWMSGYIWPAVLLVIGILLFWIGLVLASELGYRAWQSMPDPPPEAFSDTSAMGAWILGWLPGGVFCFTIFGLVRGLKWLLRWANPDLFAGDSSPATEPTAKPVETGNPYQGPNSG